MSQICPRMAKFLFQPILAAFFVTIVTVKVESIPEFYALVIALIKYLKETTERATFIF